MVLDVEIGVFAKNAIILQVFVDYNLIMCDIIYSSSTTCGRSTNAVADKVAALAVFTVIPFGPQFPSPMFFNRTVGSD